LLLVFYGPGPVITGARTGVKILKLATAGPDGCLDQYGGHIACAVDVYTLNGQYGNVSLVSFGAVGVAHDWLGILNALLVNQVGAGCSARGSGPGPFDQIVVIVKLIISKLEVARASIDIGRNLIQIDTVAIGEQQWLGPELLRPTA
jgi:hypothetical protein